MKTILKKVFKVLINYLFGLNKEDPNGATIKTDDDNK